MKKSHIMMQTTRTYLSCNHKWIFKHKYNSKSLIFRVPVIKYIYQCKYCSEIKKV